MEAAQTTCGENERKHYSRTKSEKKKKKKLLYPDKGRKHVGEQN